MAGNNKNDLSVAITTSVQSIIINLFLSILKLIAGYIASSKAMISDAIHSASDVFSSIIVIIGIKVASVEPDKDHPYGHERFESVAAIILANILFLTGLAVGRSGILSLINGEYTSAKLPGMLALVAAAISILVKESMYWYTRYQAKRINSPALLADAWHHRSDALSSIGAFIGIIFARNGYPFMDSIASLVICLFIAKAAFDIFMDAINRMVDKSCGEDFNKELSDCIVSVQGVLRLDSLQSRSFGNRVYVDVEIAADKNLILTEAHELAEQVHDTLEQTFPIIKHVTVHVNPFN